MAFNALIKFRESQKDFGKAYYRTYFDTNEIERWFLKIENDLQTILESYNRTFFYTKWGSSFNYSER